MSSSRKKSPFIAKLRLLLKNKEIRRILHQNEGSSRLFDGLPDQFDTIFEDTLIDTERLGEVLARIRESNTRMTDKGPVFIKESDKSIVRNWAKRIIARISAELLDEKNNIEPELLTLLAKTPETLSSRDLICAYFSIANQYMIRHMMESDDSKIINNNVMKTFMQFMNQYPKWVEDVLKERLLTVKPSYLDDISCIPEEINLGLAFGLGGTIFGLFVLGGAAAYSAYQNNKNKNNEAPHPEREEFQTEEQPPIQSPYNLNDRY